MTKTEKPRLIKQEGTFKMVIPPEVETKIRLLCSLVSATEWSGNLFYKATGSIEENDLLITCVDILPMDIGSAAFTEFEMSPEVANYMVDNLELLDCQMGLIHSHQSMAAFFSGTDTATLNSEGEHRNHFVSLIVNNKGEYVAAITVKSVIDQVVKSVSSYHTFFEKLARKEEEFTVQETVIDYYYLDIELQKSGSQLFIENKLDEIRKAKIVVPKTGFSNLPPARYQGYSGFGTGFKDTPDFPGNPSYGGYAQQSIPFEDDFVGDSFGGYHRVEEAQAPSAVDNLFKGWKNPSNVDDIILDKDFLESFLPVSKDIINSAVLQLLTGDITMDVSSKKDSRSLNAMMPSLFFKRFGGGDVGTKKFTDWAENFIDYLCCNTTDPKLKGYDVSDLTSSVAFLITEELDKLPKNKYLDIYKNILSIYMV